MYMALIQNVSAFQIEHTTQTSLQELYALAQLNLKQNDALSYRYANDLLERASLAENELYMARAKYILGNVIRDSSSIKALDYFVEATPIFEQYQDSLLSQIYYVQSNIHTMSSEFPLAMQLALRSLEYNQNEDNKNDMQRDMSFIGYIHDRMYDYRESIKWNRRALKIVMELNDKKAQAVCYGRIGIAYDELAEMNNFNEQLFDSALYFNLKAAQLSEEAGDLGFARTTYSNIGNSYSKLGDFNKAEEYTLKSLAVPGFEERKGVTLVNLVKIYLETGRYTEAKKILDSAMRNTIHYGTRKYQFEAYYRFHELAIKQGDYQKALENYVAYKSLEDSLLNETKTKQIAEMTERFKSAEKEIQLAETRASLAEKELDVQKKNTQLIGVLVTGFLLSILGYLFFNQQRLKNRQLQKENELKDALAQIEVQNKLQDQRLRISRDLHDNIGAQLTFIISSIDNLKYGFKIKEEKLTNKLVGISNFTKDTIYELRDTIWAMNKSEITIDDLQSRISNFIDKANLAAIDTKFNFNSNATSEIKMTSVQGMNVYRIIQEAVNNAIKYADAQSINVDIDSKEEQLIIEVSDNGKGFDMTSAELGNGINNMKKRAKDLDAQIIAESKPNKGTSITLTMNVNT